MEKLRKPRFGEAGPHSSRGRPFATGPNFQVWISAANRVANRRNQRQTAGFGNLLPLLTRSGKFRKVAETSFCKGCTT